MKAKTLKSKVDVSEGVLTYALTDVNTKESESVSLDLAKSFGDAWEKAGAFGRSALTFASKTRLRNETAGKSFADALESLKSAVEDFLAGEWASARAAGGLGKNAMLVRALVIAKHFESNEAAVKAINETIAAVLAAKDLDSEDENEEVQELVEKYRKAVMARYAEQPGVKHEIAKLELAAKQAKVDREAAKLARSPATPASIDVSAISIPEGKKAA